MQIFTILAVAAASTLVAGRPFETRNTQIYATFYNDDDCKEGAGIAVSVNNDGCLNESGRQSIYFQSASEFAKEASLVFSPSPDCPCQTGCIPYITDVDSTGGDKKARSAEDAHCYNLNTYNKYAVEAQSFRFIKQGCSGNNC